MSVEFSWAAWEVIFIICHHFCLSYTNGESIHISNAGFEEDDTTLVPNSNSNHGSNPEELIGWNIYDPLGVNRDDSPGVSHPGACNGCASNQGVSLNDPIYGDSAPEGNTCLYLWAGDHNAGAFGVEQDLLSTFEPLTSYILSVKVGNQGYNCWIQWNGRDVDWCDRCNGFSGYVVQLVADNIIVAQDDNSMFITDQEWQTIAVNYTTSSTDIAIGKALTIRLLQKNDESSTSHCLMFDDVVLTANTAIASTTSTVLPTTALPTTNPTINPSTSITINPSLNPSALPTTNPIINPSTSTTINPSLNHQPSTTTSITVQIVSSMDTTASFHDATRTNTSPVIDHLFGNELISIGAIICMSCAGLLLLGGVIYCICTVCRRSDKRNPAHAADHKAVNIETVAWVSGTPKTIRIHTEEPMLQRTGTNEDILVHADEEMCITTAAGLHIPHSSSDEHVLPSGNVTIGGPQSGAIISAGGDERIVLTTDSESEYVPPAPLSPNQHDQENNVMISDPFTTSPRAGERI
eukprot:170498_1